MLVMIKKYGQEDMANGPNKNQCVSSLKVLNSKQFSSRLKRSPPFGPGSGLSYTSILIHLLS